MELIERYVMAVGDRLSPARRDSVQRELRAAVQDAIEERGGTDAGDDLVVEVLREFGSPDAIAARYEPHRQYLIGPELYPLFRRALRVAFTVLALAVGAAVVVGLLLGGVLADDRAAGIVGSAVRYAFLATPGIIVVLIAIFAWLQRADMAASLRGDAIRPTWDPRSLAARHDGDRAPRFGMITGLVAALVVLVMLGFFGQAFRHVAAQQLVLQPLLAELVRATILLQFAAALSAIGHVRALFRGHWERSSHGARVLADVLGIAVFIWVAIQLGSHRELIVNAGLSPRGVVWIVANAWIVAALFAVIAASSWWRIWRRARARGAFTAPEVVVIAILLTASSLLWPATTQGQSSAVAVRSQVHTSGGDSLEVGRHTRGSGDLQRRDYHSNRFGEMRELWVYTPPGYDAAVERSYPVLYLLHGVMADARAWSQRGRVPVILDSLLAARLIEPMVVVMPLGYGFPDAGTRAAEMLHPATDQLRVMREFSASLLEEALPFVEGEYAVGRTAKCRAIAGLSMGGAQSLYVGLHHPETFGSVASFGAAVIMYGGRYSTWFPAETLANASTGPLMTVGRDDFLLGPNRHFAAWLEGAAVGVRLEEVPGGHTWDVWRSELARLLPRLFSTDTAAARVSRTAGDGRVQSSWCR